MMNFDPEYIKKCMKATEIQDAFKKDVYKFVKLNSATFIAFQEEGTEHQEITLLGTGIELDTANWCLFRPGKARLGSHCPENYYLIVSNFWILPTQSQLQDMVFNQDEERACDFINRFSKWVAKDFYCKRSGISFEELILLYVMESLFHKRWNEEKQCFEVPKCKECGIDNSEAYIYGEINKCGSCWS